jgi:hypothetical protein
MINPNRHLPDRARDERALAEDVATAFVNGFWNDTPREPDVIDQAISAGAVEQASSHFTPWRAKAKDALNQARQAPVAIVEPEQKELSSTEQLVKSLAGLTVEEREAMRDALYDADIQDGYQNQPFDDESDPDKPYVDEYGVTWIFNKETGEFE